MPLRKSKLIYICLVLLVGFSSITVSEEREIDKSGSDSLSIIDNDQIRSASSDSSASLANPAGSDSLTNLVGQSGTPILPDTTAPAPISLEPVLYRPGSDSSLIKAFSTGPDDSVRFESGSSTTLLTSSSLSPTRALFQSVVIPGWGQFSNRKYIKAALVLGLESYLIQKAIDNGRQAGDWKEKWQEAKDSDDPLLAAMTSTYFSNYSSYRNDRNTQYWFLALTVFLSMFDAYVDAHLARFPDRVARPDELSLDLSFDDEVKTVLTYRF